MFYKGLLYKVQNKFENAREHYEKALEIQRNLYGLLFITLYSRLFFYITYELFVLGPIHADVATSVNNLASLFVAQNKFSEAKELYKQSLAMRTTIFGLDHPTVAATLNNYGGLLFAMKEYEAAREMFENSLKIKKKLW